MSRIEPAVPPYAADAQAAFDAITPAGRQPLILFRTLAKAPRTYQRFRAGGLLDRGPLSLRHREVVILRTCGLNRCEYEWGVHVKVFGDKAGFTAAQIASTVGDVKSDGAGDDLWTPAENALLQTCDQLNATTRLTNQAWTELRAHFDEQQVFEVFALIGFYRTVCLYANGLELPLENFAARFPEG